MQHEAAGKIGDAELRGQALAFGNALAMRGAAATGITAVMRGIVLRSAALHAESSGCRAGEFAHVSGGIVIGRHDERRSRLSVVALLATFLGLRIGNRPVSYTHLDVYKRQICTHGGGVMGEIVRKSEGVASDKALG